MIKVNGRWKHTEEEKEKIRKSNKRVGNSPVYRAHLKRRRFALKRRIKQRRKEEREKSDEKEK